MVQFLRPGSFLDRLTQLAGFDFARQERGSGGAPAPFLAALGGLAGLSNGFKPYESLTYYGDNPWLYAAISLTADEAARVKLKLFRRKKNGESEEVLEHQALATINRPMSIVGGKAILTGMQLRKLIFTFMKLNGEGFLLMDGRLEDKYGRAPTRLHPLLPAFVQEVLDPNYEIEKYVYRAAGRQIEIEPGDVVHFKDPDPKNWYRGQSPIQSARYALDSDREASRLNFYRSMNRGVPEGILSAELKLSPEESKRLSDQWAQKSAGAVNAGKTPVLPSGLKYQKIQDTNAEMQFAELKEMSRDEILANFRIPIEMLGKTDSQTRANADASNYVFQRFTILPLVEAFLDTLNNDYLPAFPKAEDLYFGCEEFVPEDLEAKRANTQALFGMGALKPNEARQDFQRDPLDIEQANVPYLPFNVMPLSAQVTTPPEEEPAEDPAGDDAGKEGDDKKKQRVGIRLNKGLLGDRITPGQVADQESSDAVPVAERHSVSPRGVGCRARCLPTGWATLAHLRPSHPSSLHPQRPG